jgi:hypothetical protein
MPRREDLQVQGSERDRFQRGQILTFRGWRQGPRRQSPLGVDVAEAWGFDVISEIVWDKLNFGLGKFPRPQHEILLVCRRGSLPFQVNNAGSV